MTPAVVAVALALDVSAVQRLVVAQNLDGWLLYDFRGQNPIAKEIVGPRHMQTRRWFYLVPREGEPVALVHKIEQQTFEGVPGRKIYYAGWKELRAGLEELLRGRKCIAMEYSAEAAIPYLSRVDAGTVELVRSFGVGIVSSADLVQRFKSRWGAAGKASHLEAARALRELALEAWGFVARQVSAGKRVTEYEVAQRIWEGYKARGLESDGPPIVAIGPNAASPHYEPTKEKHAEIKRGDLLLIDLWAKKPGGIYADETFMAFVGERVPEEHVRAFRAIAEARDAAVAFVRAKKQKGERVRGCDIDDVSRGVIEKHGFGPNFIHRTGHSIDQNVHGDGVNIDNYETHDTRAVVDDVGFSIEPGIYLPGAAGYRSEINVWCGERDCEVTTGEPQREIRPLLRPAALL